METRKLYYEDSHIREFEARVLSCEEGHGGFWVALDATAFYPEGGGQACDLGALNGIPVTDVQERQGAVVHLCETAIAPGQSVRGVIDWQRRFDLMQQHSGEHMVSGVIHSLYGWQNMGFHIGADTVTVDVAGPVEPEALGQIEDRVNAAIWEDLTVRCRYPEPEELSRLPYRSKKAIEGPVRIVEFPGVDLCACCGTHVKRTGEIGLVKLLSCVKFRNGVRLEMLSGARAFRHLRMTWEQNRQVSQAFSAKLGQTGDAARRMKEALAQEKFKVTGLQWQLLKGIAESCRDKGDVLYFAEGMDPSLLRELADRIAGTCGGTAAVISGDKVCLVSRSGDVKALGSAMADALHGRGGGRDGFFQGSIQADREAVAGFFRGFFVKSAQ